MCASSAPSRRSSRGRSAVNVARPCGGRGPDHPPVGGAPALVAVLAEQVQLPAGVADRVADPLEPAQVEGLPGGAAGDHRDREHLLGQVDEHVARVGVDVRLGRVVDDRGEGAVEVQPDDRLGGCPDQGGVLLLALVRGELHARSPPHSPAARDGRTGQSSGAGEDDREPVEPHRVDRGRGALDAEVEGEQLARLLQPLGVVDGRGGDGAVPVVGADHLPADLAGPRRDLAGQAGDVGVVEDDDVDLRAVHLRLLRLSRLVGVAVRGRRRRGLRLGDGGDLLLLRRTVPGGDERDAGHRDGDHAEDHHRRGEDHAALVARVPPDLRPRARPRSRGGGPSAAAGGRRAADAAGGPAAGRPRGPPAGR